MGTGFNERSAAELRKEMDKLIISKPAVDTGRKRNAVFLDPKLVAEIEYRGWTRDGKLRHASYKGLRDAADEAAVYELEQLGILSALLFTAGVWVDFSQERPTSSLSSATENVGADGRGLRCAPACK
ncbi:ATP dependent DNA ligase [Rhizobium redzepovicii]|uniref:ATP dependent DNA ligase n=1 Tax=Rhizobium redzepovicii TaxID=2867518 RepID=UPI0035C666D4